MESKSRATNWYCTWDVKTSNPVFLFLPHVEFSPPFFRSCYRQQKLIFVRPRHSIKNDGQLQIFKILAKALLLPSSRNKLRLLFSTSDNMSTMTAPPYSYHCQLEIIWAYIVVPFRPQIKNALFHRSDRPRLFIWGEVLVFNLSKIIISALFGQSVRKFDWKIFKIIG